MPRPEFLKRKKHVYVHQLPGRASYIGEKEIPLSIEVTDYDATHFKSFQTTNLSEVLPYRDSGGVSWINVKGLNKIEEIRKIGDYFGIHQLVVEDIVNTNQRPKVEEYEHHIFVVLKMLHYNTRENLTIEHFCIVLGPQYVLTFHEAESDVFSKLRDRIRQSEGRIRNEEADYLMYCILDNIIDEYFNVVETIMGKAESLEIKLYEKNPPKQLTIDIQSLKHEIIRIRRGVFPLSQDMKLLEKTLHVLIKKKTHNYIRDLADHLTEISENVEVYREIIWGLTDLYLATLNNKMSEIMKTLTILASIFIPLTFIAGVYGMNFQNMPELNLKYGYFYILGFMALVTAGMIWYFRKKKWM